MGLLEVYFKMADDFWASGHAQWVRSLIITLQQLYIVRSEFSDLPCWLTAADLASLVWWLLLRIAKDDWLAGFYLRKLVHLNWQPVLASKTFAVF